MSAIDETLAAFDVRTAADHGLPAVLRAEGGDQHDQATLVRIPEPGCYYLHLVVSGDGRVWAALTATPFTPDAIECEIADTAEEATEHA